MVVVKLLCFVLVCCLLLDGLFVLVVYLLVVALRVFVCVLLVFWFV